MSEKNSASEVNVRSTGYLIARTSGTCWRCCATTRLVALALPPRHECLMLDEAAEPDTEIWESSPCNAFLFYIEYLPDDVQCHLQSICAGYRPAYSAQTLGTYYVNHCEKCGSLLDDHALFCEPEGAFLPVSAAAASVIELLKIDESLEAFAAGYACEPQFFESMAAS